MTRRHEGPFSLDGTHIECDKESLRKKNSHTFHKIKKLKKSSQQKKTAVYSEKPFMAPQSLANDISLDDKQKSMITKIQTKTKDVIVENRGLKRELSESREEIQILETTVETLEERLETFVVFMSNIQNKYKSVVRVFATDKQQLKEETNRLSEKYKDVAQKLDSTVDELNKTKEKLSKYNTRNVNKRHKRLNTKYEDSLRKNVELGERVVFLERELEEKEDERRVWIGMDF